MTTNQTSITNNRNNLMENPGVDLLSAKISELNSELMIERETVRKLKREITNRVKTVKEDERNSATRQAERKDNLITTLQLELENVREAIKRERSINRDLKNQVEHEIKKVKEEERKKNEIKVEQQRRAMELLQEKCDYFQNEVEKIQRLDRRFKHEVESEIKNIRAEEKRKQENMKVSSKTAIEFLSRELESTKNVLTIERKEVGTLKRKLGLATSSVGDKSRGKVKKKEKETEVGVVSTDGTGKSSRKRKLEGGENERKDNKSCKSDLVEDDGKGERIGEKKEKVNKEDVDSFEGLTGEAIREREIKDTEGINEGVSKCDNESKDGESSFMRRKEENEEEIEKEMKRGSELEVMREQISNLQLWLKKEKGLVRIMKQEMSGERQKLMAEEQKKWEEVLRSERKKYQEELSTLKEELNTERRNFRAAKHDAVAESKRMRANGDKKWEVSLLAEKNIGNNLKEEISMLKSELQKERNSFRAQRYDVKSEAMKMKSEEQKKWEAVLAAERSAVEELNRQVLELKKEIQAEKSLARAGNFANICETNKIRIEEQNKFKNVLLAEKTVVNNLKEEMNKLKEELKRERSEARAAKFSFLSMAKREQMEDSKKWETSVKTKQSEIENLKREVAQLNDLLKCKSRSKTWCATCAQEMTVGDESSKDSRPARAISVRGRTTCSARGSRIVKSHPKSVNVLKYDHRNFTRTFGRNPIGGCADCQKLRWQLLALRSQIHGQMDEEPCDMRNTHYIKPKQGYVGTARKEEITKLNNGHVNKSYSQIPTFSCRRKRSSREAAESDEQIWSHIIIRHSKEMRNFHKFMDLEPVVETDEDSAETGSISSGPSSLSPPPFTGDIWSEIATKGCSVPFHIDVIKEHLQLQRAFEKQETELFVAKCQARKFRRALRDGSLRNRRPNSNKNGNEVNAINIALVEQIQFLESKEAALRAEAKELSEQNELLEFRILELEGREDNRVLEEVSSREKKDVWTEIESDISDSGVHSLPSEDLSFEGENSKQISSYQDLTLRIIHLLEKTTSIEDKNSLQQVVAMLRKRKSKNPSAIREPTICYSSIISHQENLLSENHLMNKSFHDSPIQNRGDDIKTNKIIATVLPFIDTTSYFPMTDLEEGNSKIDYSSIKNHILHIPDNLQESGIFDEGFSSDLINQGTQTEWEKDLAESKSLPPLLENLKPQVVEVGELRAEIKKLSKIRKMVEEREGGQLSKKLCKTNESPTASLHDTNQRNLNYYKERVEFLERKVKAYESSQDEQIRMLANGFQREVTLKSQIKDINQKLEKLRLENNKLEEEKCEFEEAENDTRLRCQKMEVKLLTVSEKKSDLQTQLQRERKSLVQMRRAISDIEKKKLQAIDEANYLKNIVSQYEERNYELEEREIDLRHKLESLELFVPALIFWNIWIAFKRYFNSWRMISATEGPRGLKRIHSSTKQPLELPLIGDPRRIITATVSQGRSNRGLEKLLNQRKRIEELRECLLEEHRRKEAEWKNIEEKLMRQVVELTESVEKEKQSNAQKNSEIELLEQRICEISLLASEDKPCKKRECGKSSCVKRIKSLEDAEKEMKSVIQELERKEMAYKETIRNADDIWTELEESYKKRLAKSEANEVQLHERVNELQEIEAKLRKAVLTTEETGPFVERIQELEQSECLLQKKVSLLETEKMNLQEENKHHQTLNESLLKQIQEKNEGEIPLKQELAIERKTVQDLQLEFLLRKKSMDLLEKRHLSETRVLNLEIDRLHKEMAELEITNNELKEEVGLLEIKVAELKSVIESQKDREERFMIEMGQEKTLIEKELEELKRQSRDSKLMNAQQELEAAENATEMDDDDYGKGFYRKSRYSTFNIEEDEVDEELSQPNDSTIEAYIVEENGCKVDILCQYGSNQESQNDSKNNYKNVSVVDIAYKNNAIAPPSQKEFISTVGKFLCEIPPEQTKERQIRRLSFKVKRPREKGKAQNSLDEKELDELSKKEEEIWDVSEKIGLVLDQIKICRNCSSTVVPILSNVALQIEELALIISGRTHENHSPSTDPEFLVKPCTDPGSSSAKPNSATRSSLTMKLKDYLLLKSPYSLYNKSSEVRQNLI